MIGAVITFNLVLVISETDDEVSGGARSDFYSSVNLGLLIFYCVELAVKMCIYRTMFFHEYWNCLDLSIVSLDLVFLFFGAFIDEAPSFNFLRIFRLARLLRAFRMASMFPELNLLMKGLFGALRAIFWGVLMVCLILAIWSIL